MILIEENTACTGGVRDHPTPEDFQKCGFGMTCNDLVDSNQQSVCVPEYDRFGTYRMNIYYLSCLYLKIN